MYKTEQAAVWAETAAAALWEYRLPELAACLLDDDIPVCRRAVARR
ncbi:hypothetical protein [Streptomyces rimosus]|nr:hypothetical protein [Streptomyces rimosus]